MVRNGTPAFLCSECDFSLLHLPSGSAEKISSCIVSVVRTVLYVGRGCFFGVCGLHCNGGDVRPNFNCDPIKKIKVFFTHVHHGEPKSSVQFHRTTSVSRRAVTAVFTLGYFTSDFPVNLRLFLPKTAHQKRQFLVLFLLLSVSLLLAPPSLQAATFIYCFRFPWRVNFCFLPEARKG